MRSKKEAKRILKAFGRAEGKARIEYIDSFLPEKTSYIRSINYKHMLRRAAIVVVLMVMIMALAASAYAAVLHYLNYTKIEHKDNDEYVSVDGTSKQDDYYDGVTFFEPTYIPDEYTLQSDEYDEVFQERIWKYSGKNGKAIQITECSADVGFHVDNERSTVSTEIICDMEVLIYSFDDRENGSFQECYCQKDGTLIMIAGNLNIDELRKVIEGLVMR